jgi:ADP-ribose pyrophosphatase
MEINTGVGRTEQVLSPWVTLVTHKVQLPGMPGSHQFHSFKQADYVTMFAVTVDGKIPLVRQYRPALERFTLELPSGLLDNPAEPPAQAAARELFEETGLTAGARVQPLGCVAPDSARLENRLWAFFAPGVSPEKSTAWQPDPQLECLLVSREELKEFVLDGRFEHALHLAVIGLAVVRGLFSFD